MTATEASDTLHAAATRPGISLLRVRPYTTVLSMRHPLAPIDVARALVWVDWPGTTGSVPGDLVMLEVGDPTPEGQALLSALASEASEP